MSTAATVFMASPATFRIHVMDIFRNSRIARATISQLASFFCRANSAASISSQLFSAWPQAKPKHEKDSVMDYPRLGSTREEVAYFAPSAVALVIIFIIGIFTPREWPIEGYGAMAATVYAIGKKFGWEMAFVGLLVCATLFGYLLIGASALFIGLSPVLVYAGLLSNETASDAYASNPTLYIIAILFACWFLIALPIAGIVVLVRRFKKTRAP